MMHGSAGEAVPAAAAAGQDRAPVYAALAEYGRRGVTALHTPAHKGTFAVPGLEALLTAGGLAADLPSMDATDNPFHPNGCIAEAQRLAAELYGAEATFFLVNGSTIGVQTMFLAAAAGGRVLLPRYFHMSAFAAMALAGVEPVYLAPRWHDRAGPLPPGPGEVDAALRADRGIAAVFLTHPTYYGLAGDVAAVAEVCRRHDVPLLVDEAHGAHLAFLPEGALRSALDQGADLVVQSPHKTLGSLVGTAQLHVGRGSRIGAPRVQGALNLLQSTSSSYLLYASLDLVRRWMAADGRRAFARSAARAARLRERLRNIAGIRVLDSSAVPGTTTDPLRLILDVSALGLTGFDVESRLLAEAGLYGEFCDARSIGFVLGPADADDTYRRLEDALRAIAASCTVRRVDDLTHELAPPPLVLSPREAAFRPKERVPLRRALGRTCGEVVTMYPPGIPIACPGERVTEDVVVQCEQLASRRACVFAEDPSLDTIVVTGEPA